MGFVFLIMATAILILSVAALGLAVITWQRVMG